MTPDRLARVCAQLLVWEWREREEPGFLGAFPEPGDACVWPRDDGRFDAAVWRGRVPTDRVGSPADEYVVDLPTLMVAALLRHAGSLDVGPCPVCEGEKRQWSVGSDLGPDGEGWQETDDCDADGLPWWTRPCPVCVDDGKPTGRRTVSAPEAVLPGHEGAREALRALAEEYREHLPVIGDHFESIGGLSAGRRAFEDWARDQETPRLGEYVAHSLATHAPNASQWLRLGAPGCPGPRTLAECPAVSRFVLAWLAGECPTCQNTPPFVCVDCDGRGLAIGPHLPALEAHLTAAWERETTVCEECHATGSGGWVAGGVHSERCQRCAGLGRVTEEKSISKVIVSPIPDTVQSP